MKVVNTKDYNLFLKKRGALLFDIFDRAKAVWYNEAKLFYDKKGSPPLYSDELIMLINTVRYLCGFGLREVVGLFESVVEHYYKNPYFEVPDHTVISRRSKTIDMPINDHRKNKDGPIEVCIDSSGINIYNTNRDHTKNNSQTRKHKGPAQVRKLHAALDPQNGHVVDLIMTDSKARDHTVGIKLINRLPDSVQCCYADGAYDTKSLRKSCAQKNIKQVIPPICTAKICSTKKNDPPNLYDDRNEAVQFRKQYTSLSEGHKAWKIKERYGTRVHVEGFFSRLKRRFGFHFRSKSEENRLQELRIKTKILNDFNKNGRPVYQLIS